jgi:ABC-2 type transport system ATP-binding protein
VNDVPLIDAVGLVKTFGNVSALDGLDLLVRHGRVVALLGPNGAGKTTLVRTIATLVRPDAGTLRVAGIDAARHPSEVRRLIGMAGQFAAVEETMTGRENVQMIARLYGRGRQEARRCAEVVLAQMGLVDAADRLVRTYSGGMRRRLDLGVSLVGRPRLLLLDEPTTGLDPYSRMELWEAIRSLAETGTDVLLTTQHLDEADHLASQVVIVDRGRVVAEGTPSELRARVGRDVIEVHAGDGEDLARLAALLAPLGAAAPRVDLATRRVSMPVAGRAASVPEVVRAVDRKGMQIDDVALRRPTLDEVFLALTRDRGDSTGSTGSAGSPGSPGSTGVQGTAEPVPTLASRGGDR